MLRLFASICALSALLGCGGTELDARQREVASVLAEADLALLRARPALVAGKYQRMAGDTFSFYRGELPLFLHDWENGAFGLAASRFPMPAPPGDGDRPPLAVGDPHPENFGILLARDESFGFEPNDFDSADRAPYLWDVRRLVVGVALTARLANPDDAGAQKASAAAASSVARAAATSYARAIAELAKGASRARVASARHDNPALQNLFDKAAEDLAARSELDDDTVLSGGVRRLLRGALSPDEPTQAFADLPASARALIPEVLAAYRQTLERPPPPAFFEVLDAVREFGAGVASWPRVRVIVLVRGPSDDPADDVLLEIKEMADASLPPLPPPGVDFDTVEARVLATSRAAWGTADAAPLWGTTDLIGLPCQVRLESGAEHGLKVAKLTGDRGTPAALEALATTLGALLARLHASPLTSGERPAVAIASAIGGDVEGFVDEQTKVATSYADVVFRDAAGFGDALEVLGPTLGISADPADAPPPDVAALFGNPP